MAEVDTDLSEFLEDQGEEEEDISPSTNAPPKPKMGTVEETYPGSKVYHYLFGGKPKADWSGLDNPEEREVSDMHYRSVDPVKGQRSTLHRTKGLSKPFVGSGNLLNFQDDVMEHLEAHGLDTITYLPDPRGIKGKVYSVIHHHSRYTSDIKTATAKCESQRQHYDTWDKKNDGEAKQFLMNSLHKDLKREFKVFYKAHESFAATWLRLVKHVLATSSKLFDAKKERIRSLRPHLYSGQDISMMAKEYIKLGTELEAGGHYDSELTLNMVEGFLQATPDAQQSFHFVMNELKRDVSKKVQETTYMSNAEKLDEFKKSQLSFNEVCAKATEEYKILLNDNQWEPAKLPKDRSSAPSINLTQPESNTTQVAQILQLLKNFKSSDGATKNKRKCFNCGSTDHLVKDCTKPKQPEQQSKSRRHTNMAKWKLTPPKGNEPHSKNVKGRLFHWCGKCENWTSTHNTSTHTGSAKKKNTNQQANLTCLELDACAWRVEIDPDHHDKFSPILLGAHVLCFIFMAVMHLITLFNISVPSLSETGEQCMIIILNLSGLWCKHQEFIYAMMTPFFWFYSGYMFKHYQLQSLRKEYVNDLERFNICKRKKHKSKIKCKLKKSSAQDHNLVPQYPLRLRKQNLFNTRSKARKFAELQCWYNELGKIFDEKFLYQHSMTHARQIDGKMNRDDNKTCNSHHQHPTSRNTVKHPSPTDRKRKHKRDCGYVNVLNNVIQALKVTTMTPSQFNSAIASNDKCDVFPIIWDTGASICITPDRSDFLSYSSRADINKVKGLADKRLKVAGVGDVLWSMHNVNGTLRHFKLRAYHVPHCGTRLMSTNVLLNTYEGEHVTVTSSSLELSGMDNDDTRGAIMVHNNPITRLPTATGYRYESTTLPAEQLCHVINTVHDGNGNLNEAQKELIRWHQKLGHIAFAKVQHLLRTGVLSNTERSRRLQTAACKIQDVPKCAACLFGKQTVRASPGTKRSIIRDRAGVLQNNNLLPGAEVSVDHFVSSVKGRSFTGFDRGVGAEKYVGGCIFVDHASGYIHTEMQPSLSTHETLRAKGNFERMCQDVGVSIKTYMSDNGKAFTSRDFTNHLTEFDQVSKLAGVGAHHHNAQAERSIRTIMTISRTMMMHAGIHWPEMAKASLWPMAVRYACYLWNHVPDPTTGLSPSDLFTKTRWPQKNLHHCHVWGCPVYVLNKKLQDGMKLPKWEPRSQRYIYMGMSPKHAASVPLVLNVQTGAITPQYHVVFDDWFATVSDNAAPIPDFQSNEWNKLFGDSTFQYVDDDDEKQTDAVDAEDERQHARMQSLYERQFTHQTPLQVPPPPEVKIESKYSSTNTMPSQIETTKQYAIPAPSYSPRDVPSATKPSHVPRDVPSASAPSYLPREVPYAPTPSHSPSDVPSASAPSYLPRDVPSSNIPSQLPKIASNAQMPSYEPSDVPDTSLSPEEAEPSNRSVATRSSVHNQSTHRKSAVTNNDNYSFDPEEDRDGISQRTRSRRSDGPRRSSRRPKDIERLTYSHNKRSFKYNDPSAFLLTLDHPMIMKASTKNADPDTLSYEEAMNSNERNEWIQAAADEIASLESFDCWEEIPLSKATSKVLPGTWVFRVKRAPDGTFKKFKARYCIRGDLQEGEFDTFAPVVQFSSVRLFLAWSLILRWTTCSIDFSNAFIQANINEPTFIHLPRGFKSKHKFEKSCLKLRKSIYGLSVAPRLWFQHLWSALKQEGLTQSSHDPCLMFKKNMIIICYVDDLGIQAPTQKDIDELIKNLMAKGFSLTREGSFSEYLGIQYQELNDGSISMTQEGLINKIATAMGLENCNPNYTPCAKEALGSDENGANMKDGWNYRSIVGMLLYLSTNTRPDIAFAVSQVARFSHFPKQSHASAVKTIVRYLVGTKDKGVIYTRPNSLKLECYVDADFAGLYGRENNDNPTSVKSRTGYIISVGGCFILCKSQLQSVIALSTSEAEYGALSQAMRTLLPLRNMISELIQAVDMISPSNEAVFGSRSELKEFPTTIHEDNAAALNLATKQKITTRTKHWSVKLHFFWSHINNKDLNIRVVKVGTKEQKADYLTKGLTRDKFEHCRKLNQGW